MKLNPPRYNTRRMISIDDLWVVLIGICVGWGINYLADVLPIKRRLVRPFCLQCGIEKSWTAELAAKRCSSCGKPTPFRFWAVMVSSLVTSVFLWHYPSFRLGYWIGLLLLVYMGVVAVIDLEYRLVLFPVSIVGAVVGLALGIWLRGVWVTVLGGIAGFGVMFGLYYLGDLFARWMARMRGKVLDEVALGFGDVMLSGVLGLILGWPGIVAGLVLAILLGGVVSMVYIVYRMIRHSYQPFIAIPYAPFLIIGTILLLYRH